MNAKVHPAMAAVVILLMLAAVGLWSWADRWVKTYGGPSGLSVDPDGNLYVHVYNQLLRHDPDGRFDARIDLGALGAGRLIGDTGFFANGELLLRLGDDPRSLADTLRAFRRETNRNPTVPGAEGAGLARCSLADGLCRAFAEPPFDPGATFGVFIDRDSGELYLSDTSRHVLRKFAADGSHAGGPADGFRFPNQLMLYDGELYVADTNNHRIAVVQANDEGFGERLRTIDVVPPEARRAGHTWPSHFARVGDRWWVNNMDRSMAYGGIYVFDDDWNFLSRVELPGRADPIAIQPFRGDVLVSDWFNDRVYRVSADGTRVSAFESAGLDELLAEFRERRLVYRIVSYSGFAFVVLVFIMLVLRAVQSGESLLPQPPDVGAEPLPATDKPLRFEPDPAVRKSMERQLYIVWALPLVGIVFLVVYTPAFGSGLVAWLPGLAVVGVTLMLVAMATVLRGSLRTAISVDGDRLVLRDHRGEEHGAPIRHVIYTRSVLAVPGAAVLLGQGQFKLYDRDALATQLFPRLGAAERVSEWQMQKHLLAIRHPQAMLIVYILIAAALAAVGQALLPTSG